MKLCSTERLTGQIDFSQGSRIYAFSRAGVKTVCPHPRKMGTKWLHAGSVTESPLSCSGGYPGAAGQTRFAV